MPFFSLRLDPLPPGPASRTWKRRCQVPGRGYQEEGGSPEGQLQPARRGCPLPSHVAWWVGTDLKL